MSRKGSDSGQKGVHGAYKKGTAPTSPSVAKPWNSRTATVSAGTSLKETAPARKGRERVCERPEKVSNKWAVQSKMKGRCDTEACPT